MLIPSYAYFVGLLILFMPWLIIFLMNPKSRKEILIVGTTVGLLATATSRIFASDYWDPDFFFGNHIPLEDFFYGFLSGGISAGSLHLLAKSSSVKKVRSLKREHAVIGLIICVILFFISTQLGFSAMYFALLVLLTLYTIVVAIRPDLWLYAIAGGAILTIVSYIGFLLLLMIYPNIFDVWWNGSALTGIYIGPVPFEELLWAFCFGMVSSPSYEIVYKRKLKAVNV